MSTPSVASFFQSASSTSSPSKGKGEKRQHVSIGGDDDDDDDDDFVRPPTWGRAISTSEPEFKWMTADELPAINHAERFMAMYRTIIALNLTAKVRALYTEEVNGRVNTYPSIGILLPVRFARRRSQEGCRDSHHELYT